MSGTISAGGGTFDELAPGSTLYMTALKYRPQNEMSIADFEEQGYDYQVFEWADLEGKTEVEWKLAVPRETIAYMWAYIDEDNDGIVNEPHEPISSAGQDENGKFPTGNYAITDIELILLRE